MKRPGRVVFAPSAQIFSATAVPAEGSSPVIRLQAGAAVGGKARQACRFSNTRANNA